MIYCPPWDREEKLAHMFDYAFGRNGIEPKLKLKLRPLRGVFSDGFSLERIICNIILGPSTVRNKMTEKTVKRMLEKIKKDSPLIKKVTTSSTPYRPT